MAPRVVITGASSGLGHALARHYAGRGATLGLIARRSQALEHFAAGLGVPAACYEADVRQPGPLRAAAADFISRFGAPDIVIANAGVSGGTLTERGDDFETVRAILETNVLGLAATFQPFIAAMRTAGTGRLVGIASVAGYRGLPGAGAYSASKAAAIAYLEALRGELRSTGIRVITVCPGFIATPMTARNPYHMPFMMQVDDAARRIARVIAGGRSYAVIPWQMAVVARLLRLLPNPVFDATFSRRPHKPRGL
ncbi:MAG TPA: SDR family oxidoreductase [Burkholderiales bacterium]|nr:SDR family oxidoreductase [Burkholderiales bacterium]